MIKTLSCVCDYLGVPFPLSVIRVSSHTWKATSHTEINSTGFHYPSAALMPLMCINPSIYVTMYSYTWSHLNIYSNTLSVYKHTSRMGHVMSQTLMYSYHPILKPLVVCYEVTTQCFETAVIRRLIAAVSCE